MLRNFIFFAVALTAIARMESSASEVTPLAFPGAEGFGASTKGGRGGRILEVTNLEDSGPGSFRAACEAEGPRTVVFRTSGTLRVKKRIEVRHPFITIAGQTAPGGGICLSIDEEVADGGPLKIMTSEVIIRYMRFRPGPPRNPQVLENVDGLTIANADQPIRRVIIDHCSFSWSTDELFNTWYDVKDVTVQWCLFAEALAETVRGQGNHSKGPLLGSKGGDRQSFHHNLMVHNAGRNPMIKLHGLADVINNFAHVPGQVAMSISDEYGLARVNFIGNIVTAPNGDGLVRGCSFLPTGNGFAVFSQGNIGPLLPDAQGPQAAWFRNIPADAFVPVRFSAPPVTIHTASEARLLLLEEAGATIPSRDAVDCRVVEDVRAGRTRIVRHPDEVGGWPRLPVGLAEDDFDHDGMPDRWEQNLGLNWRNEADGTEDSDGDGYTNLEAYLHSLLVADQ
jgi:pectate lyase